MGYAVELFIERDRAQAIRRLFSATRSVLADIGTTPHVSLAVFDDDVNVSTLATIVRAFAAQAAPFEIRFSSVGLFPGPKNVVFLAPVVSASLLATHARLHSRLRDEGLICHPCYLPGAWVPHCAITLEESMAQSLGTIRRIHEADVLGEYAIDSVSVVRFRPVVTLSSFRLRNADSDPAAHGEDEPAPTENRR